MKKSRFTEAQMVTVLREVNAKLVLRSCHNRRTGPPLGGTVSNTTVQGIRSMTPLHGLLQRRIHNTEHVVHRLWDMLTHVLRQAADIFVRGCMKLSSPECGMRCTRSAVRFWAIPDSRA